MAMLYNHMYLKQNPNILQEYSQTISNISNLSIIYLWTSTVKTNNKTMEDVEPQLFHSKSWSAEHRGSEMSYGRFFPQPVAAWMALNQPSVGISWESHGNIVDSHQFHDFINNRMSIFQQKTTVADGRMSHQQSTRKGTIKMIPLDNHQAIPVYGGMYQENGNLFAI